MFENQRELRNFLFFLYETHPLNLEDTLIGAASENSSWDAVADKIRHARREDPFASSIRQLYLYVHVPFCTRICTFCHCPRVLLRRHSEIDGFLDITERQMDFFASVYSQMDSTVLSFGGGTPSILNEKEIGRVLNAVERSFPSPERKILFEIHPTSWSEAKLDALKRGGLYRVSVGVQSFDDHVLKNVARSQTREKVLWTIDTCRTAGIPLVNIDLLAGLPGQSFESFMDDLRLAVDQGVNEIHLQPYTSFPLTKLASEGESIHDFLHRRDSMLKKGEEFLFTQGFRCKGLGSYTCDQTEPIVPEWDYLLPRRAFASFGPYAIGEFPAAVFYRAGSLKQGEGHLSVDAAVEDSGYVMSQYAVLALVNGLHERVFADYFGVDLDQHCGKGLRFLEDSGLIAFADGTWRFAGEWKFRRVYEYAVLSRVLFGETLLGALKVRFHSRYNARHEYDSTSAFLKAYTENWLMTLYHQRRL